MLIGESAHGDTLDAAHVNTIQGLRSGPVGTAWATALATPAVGHVPFVVVLQPSVAVKPFTLFVTKSTPVSEEHQNLTWGPAQAGVAAGVADAVAAGFISDDQRETDVIIASVWVNPHATDPERIYRNNRTATLNALRNGAIGSPSADQTDEASAHIFNGLYRAAE